MRVEKNHTGELFDRLENGVEDMYRSGRYDRYMRMISSLHKYSAANCARIMRQCPHATHVAGRRTWEDCFDRYIKGGEKGIRILAPVETTDDPEGMDKPGGYKEVVVYDISQTCGSELPELIHPLMADVPGYNQLRQAIEGLSPYRIAYQPVDRMITGACSNRWRLIIIREGMAQAHTIKTLIHEIAHYWLHNPWTGRAKGRARWEREVQAEAAAYVVSGRLGLDTSQYSYGYVACWMDRHDRGALEKNRDVILTESEAIYWQIRANLEMEAPGKKGGNGNGSW